MKNLNTYSATDTKVSFIFEVNGRLTNLTNLKDKWSSVNTFWYYAMFSYFHTWLVFRLFMFSDVILRSYGHVYGFDFYCSLFNTVLQPDKAIPICSFFTGTEQRILYLQVEAKEKRDLFYRLYFRPTSTPPPRPSSPLSALLFLFFYTSYTSP